ncbi:hypothetical protein [Pedobacter sp. MC2016-24]|uniref:hypothetical protein n=1 Tax=Pedobacter sp. MC2016-24 TaxID=2780090 RepID=UPI00351C6D21
MKTGIKTITPADCKRISIEISKNLNKNVSETTIKRLFGFAVAKHNFSKFTITTLSEYVNRESSGNWIPPTTVPMDMSSLNWTTIRTRASRISDFTLRGIKNRSGMPYHMTVSRKFAEHDFDDFLKSKYNFNAFISQPGYGKTILMSHLADKFFTTETGSNKDSTLLFLQASTFINKEHTFISFEDQLKSLLGIHPKENLIGYIDNNYKATKGKFVIFLDGFSDITLKRDLKKQLFESIINFICTLENVETIKMVMSMRSTTWTRFHEMIRHSAYLKSKWFPGNYFNPSEISNVPELTEKEIDMIISKMNHSAMQELSPKLKAQLKFPFHIQLYYQLKEEEPQINYSTNITFHELISRFIQENIYRSNYYTEKILFLKKLIQLTNYGKMSDSVPKDNLISELSAFKNAYMELLSDGILMEEKRFEDFHPREFVRFIHPHIFEYFLFIELLEKFHLQVDFDFFAYIQSAFECSNIRFQLLQWTIRFIVRIGDFKSLKHIFQLGLDQFELNYLILFIAENLKYRSKYSPDTIRLLKEHELHEVIIAELINFDLVDSSYKESITLLADVSDSVEHRSIYIALLTVLDILSLDEDKITARIAELKSFHPTQWVVNPHEATKLIYAKLSNKPVERSQLLIDIQSLNPEFLNHGRAFNTQTGISYLFAILLSSFYGNQEFTVNIVKTIAQIHPYVFSKRSPFSIFMLSIMGVCKAQFAPGQKTDQLENILFNLHQNKTRFKTTQYSFYILKMMQAYQLQTNGNLTQAIQYCEECIQVFKRNQLNMNCLLMYNLLISIYAELNSYTKVNEFKYERLCFMEERKISNQILALTKETKSC